MSTFTLSNFRVVSGQMNFKMLNSRLQPKAYDVMKVNVWIAQVNKMMKPIKWNKPTKSGTKMTFEPIRTQEEYDTALDEFKVFMNKVNREHGTDFSLGEE